MPLDYFYAVLNIKRFNAPEVRDLTNSVIAGLTGNPVYVTPEPSVPTFEAARDLLVTCITNATGVNASKASRELRDDQSAALYDLLIIGRNYVNLTAKGDRVKIESSGYNLAKTPENHGQPADVIINRIDNGTEAHSFKAFLQKGTMAKGLRYDLQITPFTGPMPAAPWNADELPWVTKLQSVNSRQLIVKGLTPLTELLVRIRATDRSNLGNWSNPIPFIVQ